MQKIMTKLSVGFVSATLVMTVGAPVAFAETLEISGNGNGSDNTIIVKEPTITVVEQTNESLILTGAFSSASTGGNTANGNTGGDVTVTSGDAKATTKVTVTGSSNEATLPDPCGCEAQPPDVLISGNGNGSTNLVKVKKPTVTLVGQSNAQFVGTLAKSKAKTGWNTANGNTGGTTDVTSGDATSRTRVRVTGSTNTLNP